MRGLISGHASTGLGFQTLKLGQKTLRPIQDTVKRKHLHIDAQCITQIGLTVPLLCSTLCPELELCGIAFDYPQAGFLHSLARPRQTQCKWRLNKVYGITNVQTLSSFCLAVDSSSFRCDTLAVRSASCCCTAMACSDDSRHFFSYCTAARSATMQACC